METMKTGKLELWRDFLEGGGAFTLKKLMYDYCDGDEVMMWERYFRGDFDDNLRVAFEKAIHPEARTVAVLMRGFIQSQRPREEI